MSIRRFPSLAISMVVLAAPLRAQTPLPELPLTQFIVPEHAELQLNPDPDVFPPGPSLFFGYALALNSHFLLVGMPRYKDGRVAVFTRKHQGPWKRTASLDPADVSPGDFFGDAIALRGNLAVVRANSSMRIFRAEGARWRQLQKLPRFVDAAIGASVVFGGDPLFEETGAVHVFRPDKRGRFRKVQTLIAQEALPGALFGSRIAVSDDTLVVGAPRDVEGRGAAYIFKRHGGRWRQSQQLIAINGEPDDDFGTAVSISGGRIVIGAPGARSHAGGLECADVQGVAYVFAPGRGLWLEQQKVEAPQCVLTVQFASEVDISHDRLAIGVPRAFPLHPHQVFLYERRNGGFIPTAFTNKDLEDGGDAIALYKSTLVVGWPFRRGGYDQGYADIFEL
jgi:FG-GAP repeat